MKAKSFAAIICVAALATAIAAPAAAEKWTIACDAVKLGAYDKGADRPYEMLEIKKFVVSVDTAAKTCSLQSVEGVYLKGTASPVIYSSDAAAAKCDLRVTDKGRAFMNARTDLKGEKALIMPIVTLNYEVRTTPPGAGSPEAKGDIMVISGFPVVKAKGGKYDSRVKTSCVQSKAGS